MTAFYLGALALLVLGLVFALWPLLKSRFATVVSPSSHTEERRETNVSLYKDHLSELELSLSQGQINQEQFASLKEELERNLIEDSGGGSNGSNEENNATDTAQKPQQASHTLNRFYLALVLVSLPLMAFGVYQALGNLAGWQLQDLLKQQNALQQQISQAFGAGQNTTSLESQLNQVNRQLVTDIEEYIQDRPDDLDNRVLLARTAVSIGEYDKAIETYQQILEKQPDAAQMMAELAQAVFVKTGNQVVPVVAMLANQALKIQPENVMALGLMGIASFQAADYQKAIDYWQQAIKLYPPGSANARALQNGVSRAQAALLADGKEIGSNDNSDDNAGDAQAQEQVASGDQPKVAKVRVAVSLAEGVPAEPDHAVFVYARAWQGAKVPLAIARLRADQLPLTLELDESMNMAPGMTLSTAKQVELIARLSPSGDAISQPDDWQVSIGPIDPKNTGTTVYPLVIAKPLAGQ